MKIFPTYLTTIVAAVLKLNGNKGCQTPNLDRALDGPSRRWSDINIHTGDERNNLVSGQGFCHKAPRHLKHRAENGVRVRFRCFTSRKGSSTRETCTGCCKQIRTSKLVSAPCEHKYCQLCLSRMGQVALQDEQFFPVRCCSQEIPAEQIFQTNWHRKSCYKSRADERATPPAERWYCPRKSCGRWIPPKNIATWRRTQRCPYCRAKICSQCHDIVHGDLECSEDPDFEAVQKLAQRHQWKRCYHCQAVVEKTEGCSHIICKCGAEFCYTCAYPYSRCKCGKSPLMQDNNELELDEDLDIRIVVAAMQQAEREEAEIQKAEQSQ